MDLRSKEFWRKVWWVILILAGGYYFFTNYERIGIDPNAIDGLITLSLLILVFMPLVTEMLLPMKKLKKLNQNLKSKKNMIKRLKLNLKPLQIYMKNILSQKNKCFYI